MQTTVKEIRHWHHLEPETSLDLLQSQEQGLSEAEAQARLALYGPNVLPEEKPLTLVQIILHQFANPLIFILVAAAIASILIGEAVDALFIFLVISFYPSALKASKTWFPVLALTSLNSVMFCSSIKFFKAV